MLGAPPTVAQKVAATGTRRWCKQPFLLNKGLADRPTLTVSDFPVSRHNLNLSNRPVRTRMPGGVAGARPIMAVPMPIYPTGTSVTVGAQYSGRFCTDARRCWDPRRRQQMAK